MTDFEETIGIAQQILLKKQVSLFYHYEPYDGPDGRPPNHTPGGSLFQKAFHFCCNVIRTIVAANQTGKTVGVAAEVVIQMTGEKPYSMRYDEGVDTKIKRALPSQDAELGKDNIKRWGRRDIVSGEIIDHDPKAKEDGTWDCGTIIGVGQFPQEKICDEEGGQAWICSWKEARDVRWLKLLKKLIPDHCLDKTKGTDGYSASKQIFYLFHDREIRNVTFEQGYERVEAKMAWLIVLDEEPKDRRFFTGALMHCRWMMIAFTPIHGLSWTHDDIYMPAIENRNTDIALFNATAYDCPYKTKEEIATAIRTLKPWEIDAKILGKYSRQEGRPFFNYEICNQYVEEYERNYVLKRIVPTLECHTVGEVSGCHMKMEDADEEGPDVWHVYEDKRDDCAYFSAQDCAKGSDDPEVVQDWSVSYIFREPTAQEIEKKDFWPKMVASLYTPDTPEKFSWLALYGACYYNRALMCPESKGEDGGAFLMEIRDYPYIMTMTVTNNRTRKPTEHLGFDTNARTRKSALTKVRKWINSHPFKSGLPHLELLKEILAMIWLKGRGDHPTKGKSDCVIAFMIILWAWEEERSQITNNRISDKKKKGFRLFMTEQYCEKKKKAGFSGLNSQRRR